jgi:hypothetical protein
MVMLFFLPCCWATWSWKLESKIALDDRVKLFYAQMLPVTLSTGPIVAREAVCMRVFGSFD